jgi:GNAT superfamily N-acetyltransferase
MSRHRDGDLDSEPYSQATPPPRVQPQSQAIEFATGRPRVRLSTPADRRAINRSIGRAFFDDPVAAYLFPEIEARRAGFGAFAELAMDQFAGAGETYVTDPVQGAAIWQSPSPPKLGFWRQIGMAFRLLLIARGGYGRAIRLSEKMEKHHLREPHWYLATLGVDPDVHGRGLGSALLQPILERCDGEVTPAYLESSKQSNIPFYQRHGFVVSGDIHIPDGPTIWQMVRVPA